jgi:hypothetical protein
MSQTAQSYESGLVSLSREYAIPKNAGIPGELSVGSQLPLASAGGLFYVYPEPTLTRTSEGFDRVNVTAYGRRMYGNEKKLNFAVGEYTLYLYYIVDGELKVNKEVVPCLFDVYYRKIVIESQVLYVDPDLSNPDHEDYDSDYQGELQDNLTIPGLDKELQVRTLSVAPVTNVSFGGQSGELQKTTFASNVNRNYFGKYTEVEITYTITKAEASFYPPP